MAAGVAAGCRGDNCIDSEARLTRTVRVNGRLSGFRVRASPLGQMGRVGRPNGQVCPATGSGSIVAA